MELRILKEEDLGRAVELAQGVFDFDLSQKIVNKSRIKEFKEYASYENLSQMMRQQAITLWGVFDQGHLCGMSAMQTEGHITMLYVYPVFRKRGYAKQLLNTMRRYAASQLRLSKVTVSAMPVETAFFFIHNGFREIGRPQTDFIHLEAKTIEDMTYPVRKLSPKAVCIIAAVTVGAIALTAIAFLLSFYI